MYSDFEVCFDEAERLMEPVQIIALEFHREATYDVGARTNFRLLWDLVMDRTSFPRLEGCCDELSLCRLCIATIQEICHRICDAMVDVASELRGETDRDHKNAVLSAERLLTEVRDILPELKRLLGGLNTGAQ